MFYVYLLCDQNVPFYVGMGSGERYLSHERFARGEADLGYGLKEDPNPRKTRKIQKVVREGRAVEHRFWYCSGRESAYQLECFLIKHYGRKNLDAGGILTNLHTGGQGGDTWSGRSDESKAKTRQKRSDTWKLKSTEQMKDISIKSRMTKVRNGTTGHSEERKLQLAIQNRALAVLQRQRILQFDVVGNFVKEWESQKSASQILGVSQGAIANALNQLRKDGNPKQAGGFIWRTP